MRSVLVLLILVLTTSAARAEETLAYGAGGIRVGQTVVFTGNVDSAAYDARKELVWFTSKSTLQVIDLREATRKAVVIAKKWPSASFEIQGASTAHYNIDYIGAYPKLAVGKKNKVSSGMGAYEGVDPDSEKAMKKQIKKIKVVGKKFLTKLARRADAAAVAPQEEPGEAIQFPPETCVNDDQGACGMSWAFGASPYKLVVIEASCGDACYVSCRLYDPATKKFATPNETGNWEAEPMSGTCEDFVFGSDPKTYYIDSMVCTLGKSVTCTEDAGWYYVGVRL
jgi:hypothetical protein